MRARTLPARSRPEPEPEPVPAPVPVSRHRSKLSGKRASIETIGQRRIAVAGSGSGSSARVEPNGRRSTCLPVKFRIRGLKTLRILAALVACACSKDRAGGAPEASVPAAPAVPWADESTSPPATLQLLDAGRAPRRRLRYGWRADRKEELVMDLRTTASTEADNTRQPEIPLPAVHVVVDIDPQSLSPQGDMRYAWRVASSSVPTGDPQVPPYLVEGMRTEVAMIERLSGTAVVTSRGMATEVAVDRDSVVSAGGTGRMVEQMRQQLRDLAAPLPDEDVGVGAAWQKLSQLVEKDARITQTDTFTLVDLDGDRGLLDDVLAQTAPAQTLRGPSTSQAAQARMESMHASGDAKTRFNLSYLVPQTNFSGTTTMVVSGQSPADLSRRITLIMRVGI